ncbi:MAG: VIT1/CCC1 transporter family protein [Rickettsiales bacterium]|nr:VIT1/CCC1 transporter family protein [Rickettsiales bacterium]
MAHKNKLKHTSDMVLGMHDALVSQTGIIAGLTFALADQHLIILTSIISAVSTSLSMAASNYLAQKTKEDESAMTSGLYTGISYLITSALLIAPFALVMNKYCAFGTSLLMAILIIFLFNYYISRIQHKPFAKRFWEMLAICFIVSVVAFAIGRAAGYFLGIDI